MYFGVFSYPEPKTAERKQELQFWLLLLVTHLGESNRFQ